MSESKSVSVIICVHSENRWTSILQAVRSAQNQSHASHEIIVVVDHNGALKERLETALPGISIIANTESAGLSGARNSGVAKATGELLLFLDDDAALEGEWVRKVVESFQSPNVLGVMSRILPQWQGARPTWFPDEFLWVVGCTYVGAKPGAVRNLIGAAMCVSRRAFAEVGGFSERLGRASHGLPMGCEETEFCIRAAAAIPGGRFVFDDRTFATHLVSGERLTPRYFMRRCFAEGRSKALLAAMTSSSVALSAERDYALRVLPWGVANGLLSASRGDAAGIGRAIAIIGGFTATAAGYVSGKWRLPAPRPAASAPRKLQPGDVR